MSYPVDLCFWSAVVQLGADRLICIDLLKCNLSFTKTIITPSCYRSYTRHALCAGLLAKKAVEAGLSVKPYIKTSLSPGSGVVTYYLKESGVMDYLFKLG